MAATSAPAAAAAADLGIIGMAVMGKNLALNFADHGYAVSVYNRSRARTEAAVKDAGAQKLTLHPYYDLSEFVKSLSSPRKIIMMVMAGDPVEQTLKALLEILAPGDIIVDGGNEYFANTDRRVKLAKEKNIHYVGMGVSGGESGARFGPSLMPGGEESVYKSLSPMLEKIAAKDAKDQKPCVAFIGNGSAGNYVKMVHNGIEYGVMQTIADAYHVMTHLFNMPAGDIAQQIGEWERSGRVDGYLAEITEAVLKVKNKDTDKYLVDEILDSAGSKGTGMWTCQEAAALGTPCPTIQAALDSRYLSSFRDVRQKVIESYKENSDKTQVRHDCSLEDVATSLGCCQIMAYAQGFMMLKIASEKYNFNMDLEKVALIWRGGCIIRARILDDIAAAFRRNPKLDNLLLDPEFQARLQQGSCSWRKLVAASMLNRISVPGMSASLQYYDTWLTAKSPINLIQAQRDYFGAHTFKLVDKEGSWHADWATGVCSPADS